MEYDRAKIKGTSIKMCFLNIYELLFLSKSASTLIIYFGLSFHC